MEANINPDSVVVENGYHNNDTFDELLASLESIVFSSDFMLFQDEFGEAFCDAFEDTQEENRHEYMDIFQLYVTEIEAFIELRLLEMHPSLTNLAAIIEEFYERRDELSGDLFDVLYSLTEFQAFKDLMLYYKRASDSAENDQDNQLESSLLITSIKPS